MRLYGYADCWSVRQGAPIAFKINSEVGAYRADIVRLLQADDRPEGPGYREVEIDAACNGSYPGRVQTMKPGSHLRVAHAPALTASRGLAVTAWIFATAPGGTEQGIVGKAEGPEGPGYSLVIDEAGMTAFRLSDRENTFRLRSDLALAPRRWTFVAASWDAASGAVRLVQATSDGLSPHWVQQAARRHAVSHVAAPETEADLLIAALGAGPGDETPFRACFNGKIDRPRVYARALSEDEIDAVERGEEAPSDVAAAWDFAATPFGLIVPDTGPHGLHAQVVNNPARAVTDHAWDATSSCFAANPEHYAAIYFHDDDVDDAGWSTDFVYDVPGDLPSGVYAARLRGAEGEEDYVPFFVRPGPGAPRADILFLFPTFTYMAYANERFHAQDFVQWDLASDHPVVLSRQDAVTARVGAQLGPSTYDAHTDGSYCCTVSRLKPVLNLSPKLTAYWSGAGRHFGAEMYLVDWLDRKGFSFDVATDEDLDAEGAAAARAIPGRAAGLASRVLLPRHAQGVRGVSLRRRQPHEPGRQRRLVGDEPRSRAAPCHRGQEGGPLGPRRHGRRAGRALPRDDRHPGRRLARHRQGPGAPVRLRLHLAGILQGGALRPRGRQLR